MKNTDYHKAVLVKEVIHYLNPKPNGLYVDVTFGGGGHTRAILKYEPKCKLIAMDWDKDALDLNSPKIEEEFPDRVRFLWGNFGRISILLKKINISKVDGILADFGTSQYQLAQKPGFSFYIDSPLDMRMSPAHQKITAYEIVNKASELELAKIFFDYGQETFSRKIARKIVETRSNKGPIRTTKQLAQIVENIKGSKKGKIIHPATKVFQALRIVVNDELNNIKSLLKQSINLLKINGSIVCISFHSLEDQIVKDFFRLNSDKFRVLTEKVVTASKEEIKENISARSARLRAAIRINQ